MTNGNQQLTKRDRVATLVDLFKDRREEIEGRLPDHKKGMAERMVKIGLTTIQKSPKLLECSPGSLLAAMYESCELGLQLDGVLGQAYLVPFSKQAQMMIGYRGLVALAYWGAQIIVAAELVFAKDDFAWELGAEPRLKHVPKRKSNMVTHAYAVGTLPDRRTSFCVMDLDELKEIKKMSKAKGEDSPWQTHENEMMRKTPIRRLAKLLPLSADVMRANVLDEMREQAIPGSLTSETVSLGSMDSQYATELAQQQLRDKLDEAKAEPSRPPSDGVGAGDVPF